MSINIKFLIGFIAVFGIAAGVIAEYENNLFSNMFKKDDGKPMQYVPQVAQPMPKVKRMPEWNSNAHPAVKQVAAALQQNCLQATAEARAYGGQALNKQDQDDCTCVRNIVSKRATPQAAMMAMDNWVSFYNLLAEARILCGEIGY